MWRWPDRLCCGKDYRKCECKKLKKDGDAQGTEACMVEYKAWKKEAKAEAKAAAKDMSPEEIEEPMKESETKAIEARDACKAMLEKARSTRIYETQGCFAWVFFFAKTWVEGLIIEPFPITVRVLGGLS